MFVGNVTRSPLSEVVYQVLILKGCQLKMISSLSFRKARHRTVASCAPSLHTNWAIHCCQKLSPEYHSGIFMIKSMLVDRQVNGQG